VTRVTAVALGSSSSPAPPPPTSDTLSSYRLGSSSAPVAFTASPVPDSYNSSKEFDYKGKWDGALYVSSSKSNTSDVYLGVSLSCCRASTGPIPKHGGSSLPLGPSFPSTETAVCDATHYFSASLTTSNHCSSPPEPNAGHEIGITPHHSSSSSAASPHHPPPTDLKGF
jgi:hypothetical protein